ncbi:protein shisa-5-like [Garra rufa]|uniref:protein shisa-5-like n=1 Tax=Garra rufa TaxID=137080 RepID=UPI003CCEEBA6
MASTLAVLLLLSACLFTVTVGDNGCKSYTDKYGGYKSPVRCHFWEHCCGTCDDRYCCSIEYLKLSEIDQNFCNFKSTGGVVGVIILIVVIIVFITCCCCPCCCIYKMCRKPRPVAGTQVTTVTNVQCIQQQSAMQAGQYPQYQPVPPQAGYSGRPMQTGPYQGQTYAPGPPPPYHIATSPGYPGSQSAYGGGQAMYPMQPPAQPGVTYMPSETSSQPAYNPAYVQPPNTGY